MSVLQAIILGIIQGIGEFLPISSSGHLQLAQRILGIPDVSLSMDILLHVGTLVAVFVVFWRDWWTILKNPFKSHLFWMLVLATIPAGLAGVFLKDFIVEKNGLLLGICFIVTGILLTAAEGYAGRKRPPIGRHARVPREKAVEDIGPKHALAMGMMQAVGVLPGISRSGSTIVGGLFSGLSKGVAAQFSFMMSVPIILGSMLFDIKDMFGGEGGVFADGIAAPLVGVVVSGLVGYAAIRWMLKLIQKIPLWTFAIYVAVIGTLVVLDSTVFHLFF